MAALIGAKIKIQGSKERVRPASSEVERLVADPAKAKKLLKWGPTHEGKEGLKNGLLKTINWFQNPENREYYESDRYVV